MKQVEDLELTRLRVVVDVTMLSIHVEEEHAEASKSVDSKMGTVQFFRVAHNLLEYIRSAPLIEQVLAFTTHSPVVLLSQEVEEDLLLVICDTLTNHGLEERLNIVERQITLLRIRDDKLDEAHECVDVLFVGDVVASQFQILLPTSLFNGYLSHCLESPSGRLLI